MGLKARSWVVLPELQNPVKAVITGEKINAQCLFGLIGVEIPGLHGRIDPRHPKDYIGDMVLFGKGCAGRTQALGLCNIACQLHDVFLWKGLMQTVGPSGGDDHFRSPSQEFATKGKPDSLGAPHQPDRSTCPVFNGFVKRPKGLEKAGHGGFYLQARTVQKIQGAL